MSDRQLFEAKQRIATLERKVADLYQRLGQAEPVWGFADEPGDPSLGGANEDPEVISLIQKGNAIAAIKRYRELTGLGLKEAKDVVDELEKLHRPTG